MVVEVMWWPGDVVVEVMDITRLRHRSQQGVCSP